MNLKKLKYVLCIVLSTAWTQSANAQSAIQKQEKINGLNAYTWYPEGYDTAKVKRWPLILFFPSAGETGTVASKLLTYGPSKFIAEGKLKPNAVVMSIQPTTQWPAKTQFSHCRNVSIKRGHFSRCNGENRLNTGRISWRKAKPFDCIPPVAYTR